MVSFFVADFFILTASLFLSMFVFKRLPDRFKTTWRMRVLIGVYHSFFGMLMMLFSVEVADSVLLDLRLIPVLLAAYFGGLRSSLLAAGLISTGRFALFDGFTPQAVAAVALVMLIGMLSGIAAERIIAFWRLWLLNTSTAMLLTGLFYGYVLQANGMALSKLWMMEVFFLVGSLFVFGCIYFLKNTYDRHFLNKKLYDMIHSFHNIDNVNDIYEKTLRELSDLFRTDLGSIVAIRNHRYQLVGFLSGGEYNRIGSSVSLADIEALERALAGHSSIYPDWTVRQPKGLLEVAIYERGARSSIHVPIRYKNRVIALLNLGSSTPNFFNARVMKFVEDLTPSISMALALLESEARFSSIVDSSKDGIVIADSELNIVSWNYGASRTFGYSEQEALGQPVSILIPERRRKLYLKRIDRIINHLDHARAKQNTVEAFGRRKDGTIFPIELSYSIWEASGIRYYSSIIRDITRRKRNEEQILTLQRDLADTIHFQHGVVLKYKKVGDDFIYTLADGQMLKEIGVTPQQLISQSLAAASPPRLLEFMREQYALAWSGQVVECEYGHGRFTFFSTFNPVFKEGRVHEVVVSVSNISRRKQAEEKLIEANRRLELLSNVDGLTGLHNRRSFDRQLDQERERCRERGVSLTLMMMDIDAFKSFNDTYGHVAGDACLKQVADIFGELAEAQDFFAARYGGEEFACIMPGTLPSEAAEFAESVRAAVQSLDTPNERSAAGIVTVSIGTAIWPAEEIGESTFIIDTADQALYAAKSAGRNRVVGVSYIESVAPID
ncbi:diguanylate cyclase [Paenibacillus methanolicus]|uniref:PAS domain S-box-containing protein/diguanylate cyclase (GGDEF)-like protein n=1 Tax=Paenibacillus methanolicus TaxID=582686 RepID=A0A5S5CM35_9BACL|nr:diguanylate cyclase [Paenibacillus methanolicus]TYP79725.1 PAS domain S-box-containing protein/diguanylate cyclase (GGDEF)-like protein [Paenibacillus methanolicus]